MWRSLSTDATSRLDSSGRRGVVAIFSPTALRLWSDRIPSDRSTGTAACGSGGQGGWGFSRYKSPAVITPQAVCARPSCWTVAEQAAQRPIRVLGLWML